MERELIGLCKADLLSLRAKLQQYIGQLYSEAHPANLNQYIRTAIDEISGSVAESETVSQVEEATDSMLLESVSDAGNSAPQQFDSFSATTSQVKFEIAEQMVAEETEEHLFDGGHYQAPDNVSPFSISTTQSIYADDSVATDPTPSCSATAAGKVQTNVRSPFRLEYGGRSYAVPLESSGPPAAAAPRQVPKSMNPRALELAKRARQQARAAGLTVVRCSFDGCKFQCKYDYAINSLRRHISVRHLQNAPRLCCELCPYTSCYSWVLKDHMQKKHPTPTG